MADLKTKPTGASVKAFIDAIADDQKRKDARVIQRIMKNATGARPKMWGAGIVGYDRYHYKYESGREGDFFVTGFAPRKQSITLYIMSGFGQHDTLMRKLGKHKTGKSCLYINKLADIDLEVLTELVERSVEHVKKKYG